MRWVVAIAIVTAALPGCGAAQRVGGVTVPAEPQGIGAGEGVNGPRLLSRPAPSYSPQVRQAFRGLGGSVYVDLELVLHEDGTVGSVAVLDSQPANNIARTAFELESASYVKTWVFEPAQTTSGSIVAVRFAIRLWWEGAWGVQNPLQGNRFEPCHESQMTICGVDGLQSNDALNLTVSPVTARAVARPAPGQTAG